MYCMRKDITAARVLLAGVGGLLVVACGGVQTGGQAAKVAPGYPGRSGAGVIAPATAGGASTIDRSALSGPVVSDVSPPIAEGPRVIRTAQIGVEVRNGSFDSTLDQLYSISTQFGGYISGSDAAAETGSLRTGTITFQVPADHFDAAVKQVRGLGRVQSFRIGGQDVSAQYVDLQARLRNAEAQRDAMLALLAKATTIQEIVSVQTQVGQATAQVEQLRGQINYLDHATTYSTITVSIREAAVTLKPAGERSGVGAAASAAGEAFVNTLGVIMVGAGAAGPVLLILGSGLIVWRLRGRILRRS